MKIGILISGRGSNMLAIAEAVKDGLIENCEISVVISDKADAIGLKKAQNIGLKTLVIERNNRTREEHDAEIISELIKQNVDFVCLAGYMRLLSSNFILSFPNRIINIHPSLLPSFPGLDAQKQAFDYGVTLSGCTVHFVDEQLDHGAIIEQKMVVVETNDTVESLSEKILQEEHKLYIETLKKLSTKKFQVNGRKITFQ
jgi:phosphoribosylglycinamide formyltransferase 1